MKFKNLIDDERAVSPVIGVILMVAITVILAAVIGTFVLGLGDQLQDTSPQVSFGFDYNDPDSGTDTLEVTHESGDSVAASQLSVVVSGAVDEDGSDSSEANVNKKYTWNHFADPDDTDVGAGSTITIQDSNIGDGGDAGNNLDLSGATVRVTWSSDDGGSTSTLGTWSGPEA